MYKVSGVLNFAEIEKDVKHSTSIKSIYIFTKVSCIFIESYKTSIANVLCTKQIEKSFCH